MRPRKVVAALLAVPLLLALSEARAQSDVPVWLFVIQGTVTEITGDRITLDAADFAIGFTDRPDRKAATFELSFLIDLAWGEGGGFRLVPPNAALVDETGTAIAVVEITEATVDNGLLILAYNSLEGDLPAVGDDIAFVVDDLPLSPDDVPYIYETIPAIDSILLDSPNLLPGVGP